MKIRTRLFAEGLCDQKWIVYKLWKGHSGHLKLQQQRSKTSSWLFLSSACVCVCLICWWRKRRVVLNSEIYTLGARDFPRHRRTAKGDKRSAKRRGEKRERRGCCENTRGRLQFTSNSPLKRTHFFSQILHIKIFKTAYYQPFKNKELYFWKYPGISPKRMTS